MEYSAKCKLQYNLDAFYDSKDKNNGYPALTSEKVKELMKKHLMPT